MNNPFVNLRKFVPLDADPKENHATESLAACLQFSPVLKLEFLRFLFGDTKLPFDPDVTDDIEVATQVNVGKFGILDIYLSLEGQVHIVIEVKVNAPEDGTQLRDYSSWLKTQTGDEKFLFSLVCFPDRSFKFGEYGVLQRRTWRDLYSYFRRIFSDLNPTEQNLIKLFNDYLEVQQIVTTWKPTDLRGFGQGMIAREALDTLFATLSDRLPANTYQTKVVIPNHEWPRLEIGKQDWDRIFGKGYNLKLTVWLSVPLVWEAKEHEFVPEITLWHRQHGDDWKFTEPKLLGWIQQLKSVGFIPWFEGRGIPRDFDLTKSPLPVQPRRVVAYSEPAVIKEQQLEKISETDLVNTLYNTILDYCKVVDELG
jgi:hypothetical protein